ncbi:MAG: hypothetical protein DLM70_17470 [Chloroflexi bacterium]|nr:MAG: hypothetical protein DLM70_17470 [Chloroflexota bacterium]
MPFGGRGCETRHCRDGNISFGHGQEGAIVGSAPRRIAQHVMLYLPNVTPEVAGPLRRHIHGSRGLFLKTLERGRYLLGRSGRVQAKYLVVVSIAIHGARLRPLKPSDKDARVYERPTSSPEPPPTMGLVAARSRNHRVSRTLAVLGRQVSNVVLQDREMAFRFLRAPLDLRQQAILHNQLAVSTAELLPVQALHSIDHFDDDCVLARHCHIRGQSGERAWKLSSSSGA